MEEKLDQRLQVMVSRSEMEEIERWRYDNRAPSRSEAVRRMVRAVLDGGVVAPELGAPSQLAQPPQPADPTRDGDVLDRLDRLEALVARAVGAISSPERRPAPAPVRPAPPNPVEVPEDTPALDPVAEAEGLRKLAAFVDRNRLPPPPPEPPEPSIEELQAKMLALRAQQKKRPDFKPVPTNVVPAPGEGDTEPYVHLFPEEPRAPEERTSPYWDDEEG